MGRRQHFSLGFRQYLRSTATGWVVTPSVLCVLLTPLSIGPATNPRRIATAASEAKGVQISFQTIAKGHRSGVLEPLQTVVRNQGDWAALWKKHTSIESNPPLLPDSDFAKHMVVAVFAGEKPTGGHDIEITSVERVDERLLVSFAERSPSPGTIVTQAFTQPFHIAKVASQGSATVSFRRLP
jgi:hypothetical protein